MACADMCCCCLPVFPPAVRFAMDRAGLVGADGSTHCGAFDVTFMASLPNMVCMAPSNESELIHMVATSVAIDDRPSCFRCGGFPAGAGWVALAVATAKLQALPFSHCCCTPTNCVSLILHC